MGVTANRGYPFPELGDAADVPLRMQALAEALDVDVDAIADALAGLGLDALADVDLTGAADGQFLKRAGGVWVPGSATYELLAETVLGAAAASVDLQNIPQTYRHLRLVAIARSDRAAANADTLALRFNNDAAAGRYSGQESRAAGATLTAIAHAAADRMSIAPGIPATAADASKIAHVVIDIPAYRQTVFRKIVQSVYSYRDNSATPQTVGTISGEWLGTDAINRLTLFSVNAANLVAGTVVSLYGTRGA